MQPAAAQPWAHARVSLTQAALPGISGLPVISLEVQRALHEARERKVRLDGGGRGRGLQ